MPITVDHATPEQLRESVLKNLIALFRAMAEAWATRLGDGDVDAAIDETIEWFRARQAPYFFWWTGPGTAPANLGDRLRARVYERIGFQKTRARINRYLWRAPG